MRQATATFTGHEQCSVRLHGCGGSRKSSPCPVVPVLAPTVVLGDAPVRLPVLTRIWITLGLVLALAAANAYLLSTGRQPLTPYGSFMASAILWACALPLWLFLVVPRRSLGFLPAACGLYGIYFALPALSTRPLFGKAGQHEAAWDSVEVALSVALLGAIAMLVGAYGSGWILARVPRVRREVDLDRALPFLVPVSLIGFLLRFTRPGTNIELAMPLLALENIGMVALVGILLAWLRNRARTWHKVYFVGLTLGVALLGLVTGMLANVAFSMASLVFVYCWERGRFPIGPLLAGTLFLAPFQVSKHEFRSRNWATASTAGATSLLDLERLVTSFVSITFEKAAEGQLGADDVVEANEGRFDLLSAMAIVVEQTPESVPYWGGYTYADLFWHLIPRVLVPDKPAPSLGQEFPRRYGLIDYGDRGTSYNLSQTVEFYINFGWIGIGLGMFLVGIMYAALDRSLSASSGGALVGSVIFAGLMNLEANFSMYWGGLPFQLLAFYAFVWMLPRQNSAAYGGPAPTAPAS